MTKPESLQYCSWKCSLNDSICINVIGRLLEKIRKSLNTTKPTKTYSISAHKQNPGLVVAVFVTKSRDCALNSVSVTGNILESSAKS